MPSSLADLSNPTYKQPWPEDGSTVLRLFLYLLRDGSLAKNLFKVFCTPALLITDLDSIISPFSKITPLHFSFLI